MQKLKLYWRFLKRYIKVWLTKRYYDVYNPEDASDLTYEPDTVRISPIAKGIKKEKEEKEINTPEEKKLFIILDAGHGPDSPGKRSPSYNSNIFYEWQFNLDVIARVASKLDTLGINYVVVNKELNKLGCKSNCLKSRVQIILTVLKYQKVIYL